MCKLTSSVNILSVARYGAQSWEAGSEDDMLGSSLLTPLTSLLPSERETNKPLFVKCHLPGSKASWTEMERVNQRWCSVPRLSGRWCQSLCAGRPCVPSWWAQAINSDATRLSVVDRTISRNHHQLTVSSLFPCGHLCPLY